MIIERGRLEPTSGGKKANKNLETPESRFRCRLLVLALDIKIFGWTLSVFELNFSNLLIFQNKDKNLNLINKKNKI
jgi:hypothetical protein